MQITPPQSAVPSAAPTAPVQPQAGDRAPLPTVPSVDLSRYAGTWHEIARLPTRFQDDRSVSTATYTLKPDGSVGVRNASSLGSKTLDTIEGAATLAAGSDGERLRVRFGGLLRFLPVPKAGNYWVIDLDDSYSTALVGTPDRKFLWLLARDQNAWSTARAAEMVQTAAGLGFDTDRLLVADWDRRQMRNAPERQPSWWDRLIGRD